MSIITHDYLMCVDNKYDISKLLDCVLNRYNRISFERVIACLLQKNYPREKSLLGNINNDYPYGITFDRCDDYKYLPIMKCWTGR